jgi:hypothetical protein
MEKSNIFVEGFVSRSEAGAADVQESQVSQQTD